ncbi:hypothetical protein KSP40_PGU010583 [Platanthera guangdongensis]|uniref:Ubiquinol oxidase n=1 Tax=Platanthera guangdongensis TaxID=2320717 RepID=A0ABR2MP74_9ASPA
MVHNHHVHDRHRNVKQSLIWRGGGGGNRPVELALWNWRGMQDRNGGEPALFVLAAGADAANAAGRRFAEELKKLPAVQVAIDYYMNEDMYLFDEFQTSRTPNSRRPKIENLYDVFLNVRDDEGEHCKTMKACQTHGNLRSPHSNAGSPQDVECAVHTADCEGFVDCFKKSLAAANRRS